MIVGTAGHIDHGKTTLVRALTGVDTDRLPEEKKRGISIELGYAFMDLPGASADGAPRRIGFIDVPGHERLVHTMLAGATGIDYALLLVAADDGVMPQTREHLAVLSLLGIARGAVVVTKADRVDAARLQAVQAEAAELLVGTPLAGAPLCVVSATNGCGVPALRALLLQAAAAAAPAAPRGAGFRLAADRAFTLAGVGTVATGTVHAGAVAVGDELLLVPGPAGAAPLRVRSLHAQNTAVAAAHAGQRCAVALAGVAKESIARGQWLVAPPLALQTTRLDAAITLWHAEPRALRSGTAVHVHVGAATVAGTVAVLDSGRCDGSDGSSSDGHGGDSGGNSGVGGSGDRSVDGSGDSSGRQNADTIAPGAAAHVQLVLQAPLAAWHGDRVVLRDAAASRTLAGGSVLDPFAPARYRRTPQRLAERCALALPDAGARLAALLAVAANGVDVQRFAAAAGLAAAPALPPGAVGQGVWALGPAQAEAAQQALLAALQAFHARQPDALGPDAMRLRRLALPRLPEPLFRALLAVLQARGQLAVRGAFVHLPEHGVRLSAADERIAQAVAPALAQAGFQGAWARDLARTAAAPEPLVRTTLARLAQRGELHQIVRDLYLPPAAVRRLAGTVQALAAGNGGDVSAAAFRDATRLGRKRAIQVLEYFDRVGLLRRVGDVHRLRADAAAVFTDGVAAWGG